VESVPAVLALGLRVMEKGSSDARRWRFMLYVSTPFGTGLSYLDLEGFVSLIGLKIFREPAAPIPTLQL